MPDPSTFLAFAAASLVVLVIPGPAVVYILNRSVSDGRDVGLAAVAGLEFGTLVHALAAAAGLSAVLATSATAFQVVKWLGATYLVVVGIRTLLTRPSGSGTEVPAISARRAFAQGVAVNVLNPKLALFFLSFLPQFVERGARDGSPALQALLLGLTFVLLGCLTDGTYSLVASSLRDVLLRGRALTVMRRWVAGSVFVALGVAAARASTTRA